MVGIDFIRPARLAVLRWLPIRQVGGAVDFAAAGGASFAAIASYLTDSMTRASRAIALAAPPHGFASAAAIAAANAPHPGIAIRPQSRLLEAAR